MIARAGGMASGDGKYEASARSGIALPVALLLLVGATLLSHALWMLAELEVRIAEAEVGRILATRDARAELGRRAAARIRAHGEGAQLDLGPNDLRLSPSVVLLSTVSGPGGWRSVVVEPTAPTILDDLGAGVRVQVAVDLASRSRVTAASGAGHTGCTPRPLPLVRTDADSLHPAGLTLDQVIARFPAAPATLVLDTVAPVRAASVGPVRIEGVGELLLIARDSVLIAPGAEVRGTILAGGPVRVAASARLTGGVAARSLLVESGGGVAVSGCTAAAVLDGSPLVEARLLSPGAWPAR